MINRTTRSWFAVSAVAIFALAGCSSPEQTDEATTPAADTATAASETPTTDQTSTATEAKPEPSQPAATAPAPKGPWKQGDPVPTAAVKGDDVEVPDAVGSRTADETVDGITMYQENGMGPIGTIAVEGQTIDFYLQTMEDPVDYGEFICAEGGAWGGGPMCLIGLEDSTLSFQNAAGPEASVEGSAQFAAEALAQMNLQ